MLGFWRIFGPNWVVLADGPLISALSVDSLLLLLAPSSRPKIVRGCVSRRSVSTHLAILPDFYTLIPDAIDKVRIAE